MEGDWCGDPMSRNRDIGSGFCICEKPEGTAELSLMRWQLHWGSYAGV
jgi:hypothetical protein